MYGIGRLAGRDEGREHGGRSRSASDVNGGGAAGGTGVMPFAILSNRLRGSSLLVLSLEGGQYVARNRGDVQM